jgi:hypothetical protein
MGVSSSKRVPSCFDCNVCILKDKTLLTIKDRAMEVARVLKLRRNVTTNPLALKNSAWRIYRIEWALRVAHESNPDVDVPFL